jgi:hypothetical protein
MLCVRGGGKGGGAGRGRGERAATARRTTAGRVRGAQVHRKLASLSKHDVLGMERVRRELLSMLSPPLDAAAAPQSTPRLASARRSAARTEAPTRSSARSPARSRTRLATPASTRRTLAYEPSSAVSAAPPPESDDADEPAGADEPRESPLAEVWQTSLHAGVPYTPAEGVRAAGALRAFLLRHPRQCIDALSLAVARRTMRALGRPLPPRAVSVFSPLGLGSAPPSLAVCEQPEVWEAPPSPADDWSDSGRGGEAGEEREQHEQREDDHEARASSAEEPGLGEGAEGEVRPDVTREEGVQTEVLEWLKREEEEVEVEEREMREEMEMEMREEMKGEEKGEETEEKVEVSKGGDEDAGAELLDTMMQLPQSPALQPLAASSELVPIDEAPLWTLAGSVQLHAWAEEADETAAEENSAPPPHIQPIYARAPFQSPLRPALEPFYRRRAAQAAPEVDFLGGGATRGGDDSEDEEDGQGWRDGVGVFSTPVPPHRALGGGGKSVSGVGRVGSANVPDQPLPRPMSLPIPAGPPVLPSPGRSIPREPGLARIEALRQRMIEAGVIRIHS